MARALGLARQGTALASPNPMVGCALVKNGRVVGEGFHTYAGEKHAEILALEKAGGAARGATLYVNLEPCCHTGRTGPCTEAIIAAGVERVVGAMRDPNPRVAGKGFARLRRAGIETEAGVCEKQARELNEAFAKWIRTGLPFVTQKIAMSLDGFIAESGGGNRTITWITCEASRARVQQMRHAADALVTGIGTVLADNPRLTDRTGGPRRRPLLRVVMDTRLRMPLRSRLVQSAAGDLLIFTHADVQSRHARALRRAGAEVLPLPLRDKRLDLRAALRELGRREMLTVMLEGGSVLNAAALRSGTVDKMVLFIAPRILGGHAVPVADRPVPQMRALRDVRVNRCGPDIVVEGYLRGTGR
jgi:diaminohydroxyphosphoribosylaminopyrimidine deaminase/5-amino-6-(5-phosphoribosylamino)uracil reductase